QHAEPLNGVHHEKDPALPAQLADGDHVVAKAAGKLDEAEANNPRARVERLPDVIDQDPVSTAGNQADFDAAIGQVHPRIDVGGVLLGGGDHVVAGGPGEALGDDADSLAGVLDEGDFLDPGPDHLRRQL